MKNLYKTLNLRTFENDYKLIKDQYNFLKREAKSANNLIMLDEIEFAYSVLKDKEKKENYDAKLKISTYSHDIKLQNVNTVSARKINTLKLTDIFNPETYNKRNWENSDKSIYIKLLIFVSIIFLSFILEFVFPENQNNENTIKSTIESDYVESSILLKTPKDDAIAPLKLKATKNMWYGYYVYLDDFENRNDLSFFLYPGEEIELNVPIGNYNLYFAVGNGWKGIDELFKEKMSCYRYKYPLSFKNKGDQVTGYEGKMGVGIEYSFSKIGCEYFPDN